MGNEATVNQKILLVLIKNRWRILLVAFACGISAVAVTFLMSAKYASHGIIYPTNTNSIRDNVVNPNFGFEIDADRLIQLLDSKIMKDMVVEKFDLMSYYNLDSSDANWQYNLGKSYAKDVAFNRTPLLSVVITAKTKSPELSADIVNFMIDRLDSIRQSMFQENLYILKSDYDARIAGQQNRVDSLLESIYSYSQPGTPGRTAKARILEIEERERIGNPLDGDQLIKSKFMNNASLEMEQTVSEYYYQLGILKEMKSSLAQVNEALALPFPKTYVVSRGEVIRKKISPSFLTNGVIGFGFGFIVGIFYFVAQFRWRELKMQMKGNKD